MLDTRRTDTAHLAWDARWKTDSGRVDWLEPEADVVEWAKRVYDNGGRRALDLGCGVGRHSLVLAAMGFETYALDGSDSGLAHLSDSASKAGLAVATRQGLMTELPYDDASFDYVLAFNVIYHGDRPVVARAIEEIRRVLKPSGIYQGTMLSKRDVSRLKGHEISPDTFVNQGSDDKDHPHFYCNAEELVTLFSGFELISLLDKEHSRAGSWHWHLCAERL
jgi:SAM-dependent methyltransferase